MALISQSCCVFLILLTVLKLFSLSLLIWIGYGNYYNPLVIPSISEIIILDVYYKAVYVVVLLASQMALVVMYWHVEDQLFYNEWNETFVYIIVILTIIQTVGYMLISVFDIDAYPNAHVIVTVISFSLTIVRQIFFYCLDYTGVADSGSVDEKYSEIVGDLLQDLRDVSDIDDFRAKYDTFNSAMAKLETSKRKPKPKKFCGCCVRYEDYSNGYKLRILFWLNVIHSCLILGLLMAYSIVVLISDEPHTTIAMCEHLGIFLTMIMPVYNYALLHYLKVRD